jgi:predicted DNA-binding protein
MVRVTIRMPDGLHEKLRWLAFKERRSQHTIIIELLDKGLKHVEAPKEAKGE